MRTALIDGDTIVYAAGRDAEQVVDWGECVSWYAEKSDGERALDTLITRIKDGLGADRVVVALSDYDTPGWRYAVLPSYKNNRTNKKPGSGRPLLWEHLRSYFQQTYETVMRPSLEGDDVLGILLTSAKLYPGEKIVVSIDKDMGTLPGLHCNHTKDETAFGWPTTVVTPAAADYFHLWQTLTGDTTDGYPGCPGVGKVGAGKILDPHKTPDGFDVAAAWCDVVKAYEKAKLSGTEALQNARVARICRASDYDYTKREVILWNPPQ